MRGNKAITGLLDSLRAWMIQELATFLDGIALTSMRRARVNRTQDGFVYLSVVTWNGKDYVADPDFDFQDAAGGPQDLRVAVRELPHDIAAIEDGALVRIGFYRGQRNDPFVCAVLQGDVDRAFGGMLHLPADDRPDTARVAGVGHESTFTVVPNNAAADSDKLGVMQMLATVTLTAPPGGGAVVVAPVSGNIEVRPVIDEGFSRLVVQED